MRYFAYRTMFWGSWLVFPFIGGLMLLEINSWWLITLILAIFFIWARFVERYLIEVREIGKGDLKIAVISDLHLGALKGSDFLSRIVDLLNEGRPDFVLIPGDFIFAICPKNLRKMFDELERIKAPCYGVLGNHDIEPIGEFTKKEMYEALEGRVEMIDNKMLELNVRGKKIKLVGIGSLMSKDDEYELAEKAEGNVIVMAHNPDSAHAFKNENVDIMICGHTHGGQVRLWPIYKLFIPCKHKFDKGWHEINGMPVFVSSGLGEVDIPLRLFVRPEVVFLNIDLDNAP